MLRLARRRFALVSAVFFAPASGAPFRYKYGNSMTVDNPINVRAIQMSEELRRETNGRLEIAVFPNSVLGSDSAMIEQVRVGALQFSCQSGPVLAGLAPLAAIQSVPFAFTTEEQGDHAQYGELGAMIRNEIALKGGFHVFPTILAGGFRVVTSSTHPIRTADDLVGFKMRTPAGSIFVDVYRALGAQVSTLSLGEVYTALQTHLVDGQDNPYDVVENQRFYEVQKYLSVMRMTWSGASFYCSREAWKRLPADLQPVLEKHAVLYGKRVTADRYALDASVADKLRRQGLTFNTADPNSFKAKLAPWYAKAKAQYGAPAWSLLERSGGGPLG